MKLLVIGHTAHYYRDGQVVGWGPTVNEVNWLAKAFDETVHLACLHPGEAPESAIRYESDNVYLRLVPPVGGLKFLDKIKVITIAPIYITTIINAIREADVIQIRAPGGIALYAMVLLPFFHKKTQWVKYAGNWIESNILPISFAFQRWWLRKGLSRGPVTVNGHWTNQPKQIFGFHNPSLTLGELRIAELSSINKNISSLVRLIFIGRLDKGKGADRALLVLRELIKVIDVHLDIIGDGHEKIVLEKLRDDLKLKDNVTFWGWIPPNRVKDHLKGAHFILLPSESEGWPKVLSEGMAYGVVPITSNVSAIPQIISETKCGFSLPVDDIPGYVKTIRHVVNNPAVWKQHSLAGINAATRFTYEQYLLDLDHMFLTAYGKSPIDQVFIGQLRNELEKFPRE